jgi:hypothetical protein
MIQRRNSKRFVLGELPLAEAEPPNTSGIEMILDAAEPNRSESDISDSPVAQDDFHLSVDHPPTPREIQTWQSPKSLKGRIT